MMGDQVLRTLLPSTQGSVAHPTEPWMMQPRPAHDTSTMLLGLPGSRTTGQISSLFIRNDSASNTLL